MRFSGKFTATKALTTAKQNLSAKLGYVVRDPIQSRTKSPRQKVDDKVTKALQKADPQYQQNKLGRKLDKILAGSK